MGQRGQIIKIMGKYRTFLANTRNTGNTGWLGILIPATHKKQGEKEYLKKWIVARRPLSNLISRKIDSRGVYTEEYF